MAVFVGPAPEDKLPKDATPGRIMTGRLSVAKLPKAAGGDDAPGALPFTYVYAPVQLPLDAAPMWLLVWSQQTVHLPSICMHFA